MYPGAYLHSTPDKTAVVQAETGEKLSFAELEAESIRRARLLRGLGLRTGDRIAVVATNSPSVFPIYWAAMRSGLYVTMVNRHLTSDEAAYIVSDCGAEALLVDAGLPELAGELSGLLPETVHRLSFRGALPGYADLDLAAAAESSEPPATQPRGADMLYSSGTTGRPKGIKPALPDREVHEPGDTMTTMNAEIWGVTEETVYLSPAPLYHAAPPCGPALPCRPSGGPWS